MLRSVAEVSSSLESHVQRRGERHRGAERGPQAEDLQLTARGLFYCSISIFLGRMRMLGRMSALGKLDPKLVGRGNPRSVASPGCGPQQDLKLLGGSAPDEWRAPSAVLSKTPNCSAGVVADQWRAPRATGPKRTGGRPSHASVLQCDAP